MTTALLVVAFISLWAGSSLIIDCWLDSRHRPSLYDRLAPYIPTVADEVEVWLRRQ